MRHRRPDEIGQLAFADFIVFVVVNGTPLPALELAIEEPVRVGQTGAFVKGQLHLVLEGFSQTDDAVVGPDRRAPPLPFLDNLMVSLPDYFANLGKRRAAPITKLGNQVVNKLACVRYYLLTAIMT